MKNLIRNISLLSVLLFILVVQVKAQHLAGVYDDTLMPPLQDQKQTLLEVLDNLEGKYAIIFDYDPQLINKKMVEQELLDKLEQSNNVEEILKDLLKPLDLNYEKYSSNSFLIYSTLKPLQQIPKKTSDPSGRSAGNIEFIERMGSGMYQIRYVQQNISGKVTDGESGEPLPGVNILAKGTTMGTVSDINGSYRLTVSDEVSTLVFSSIGYISEEVAINGRTSIDLALMPDIQSLSEVVVVGYGTQEKENLTGSISSVEGEELTKRPVMQTTSALQGLLPGVTVTQSSGQPGRDAGNISIRGLGSFGGGGKNNPLVLVDGVETDINGVDPNDIASMTVLKDAASASIYGSRAANGVILITTKRGKEGSFSVNYNGYGGWQSFTELPEFLGSEDYMTLFNEARANEGLDPLFSDENINSVPSEAFPDVDWQEEVLEDRAFQQHHNLSISGGTERIMVRGSATYMNQQGLVPNTDYQRYGLRVNTDIKPVEKLGFGFDVSLRQSNATEPTNGSRDTQGVNRGISSIVRAVHRIPPIYAAQLSDGRWGPGWNGDNPLAWVNEGGTWDETWREALINLNARYEPVDGLSFDFTFAPRFNNTFQKNYNRSLDYYDNEGNYFTTIPARSALNLYDSKSTQIYIKALANYQKTWGAHSFNALLGFDQNDYTFRSFSAFRDGFPLPDFPELPAGSLLNPQNDGSTTEWALRSYFGRLNYSFQDKYLLEANVRYDGSSRFAEGNRWGLFPAFSAGWRVSEEPFMSSIGLISNLKLRASWGQLGNQQIGDYPYQSTVSLGTGSYNIGGIAADGAALTELANKDISWEATEMTNLGLDLGMWEGKLEMTFDYYVKNTSGILLRLNIPQTIGLDAPFQNAAEVRNTGWDLGITHRNRVNDFNYRVSFVLSDVQNEVLDMSGAGPNISGNTIITEGHPINSLYGYQAEGLFQTQEEVDNHATQFGDVAPGDIRFRDVNENGQITADDDRVIIGNQIPRYTYGLTLAADYKNFDINIFFQGVGDQDGYLAGDNVFAFVNAGKVQPRHLDRWTPDNSNASYPRFWINAPNNGQTSSYWVQDASYLRLKNLQIGYTLPESLLNKIFINRLRVYASGQNLFTIDDFLQGFDPEAPVGSGYFYPVVSTYTLGLNITL